MTPALALKNLSKRFAETLAVSDVSLEAHAGTFVTLLGPSGCGKTTLLRMIAGILGPDSGTILLDGTDITSLRPYERDIGMVFQDYALFPHMTVFENIAFGLRRRRKCSSKQDLEGRVRQSLELISLPGIENRYPGELSGGQQQRVAVARALVVEPALLLMDEPLSNLDAKIREEMRIELKQIQKKTGVTTVYVTHDQEEALAMSDQVVVMADGTVQQVGSPRDVYDSPSNIFVASFIGRTSLLRGHKAKGQKGEDIVVTDNGLRIQISEANCLPDGPVFLSIRPERIILRKDGNASGNVVPATVQVVTYSGATNYYVCNVAGHTVIAIGTAHSKSEEFRPGESVYLVWEPDAAQILPGHG